MAESGKNLKKAPAPGSVAAIVADTTAEIVRALGEGAVPWVKPWEWRPHIIVVGANEIEDIGWPRNIAGPALPFGPLNATVLQARAAAEEFRTDFWVTAERIEKLGVAPKPRARPCEVARFHPDQDVHSALGPRRWLYNLDQIGDLEALGVSIRPPYSPSGAFKFSYKRAEEARDALGANIKDGGERACYRPGDDIIEMPSVDQFVAKVKAGDMKSRKREGEAHYWATMWHEVVHWTGHWSRLNRESLRHRGEDDYAREELAAELGAAFLCSHFGIRGCLQYADYIDGWLSHLQDNKETAWQNAVRAGELAFREVRNRIKIARA